MQYTNGKQALLVVSADLLYHNLTKSVQTSPAQRAGTCTTWSRVGGTVFSLKVSETLRRVTGSPAEATPWCHGPCKPSKSSFPEEMGDVPHYY